MRGSVQRLAISGGRPVLDRLLQLDAEPADIRLLQPGFQGGVQEHVALYVLQPLPESSVRPGSAGRSATVAAVRRPHPERVLRDIP